MSLKFHNSDHLAGFGVFISLRGAEHRDQFAIGKAFETILGSVWPSPADGFVWKCWVNIPNEIAI